ncbi:UNVERIFIED_CONTAM: GTPase-activating protein GYP7 [Sesamum latifolium]|uniref:GTPase-activating protein GYP7 n=1 Tax=Sesamum latifolium TaxID=2727402 RepID=A0AAW2WY56_9LAMI
MRALRRSQTSLGSNNTTPSPSSPSSTSSSSSWIPLRSVLLIVASSSSSSSSPVSSDRGSLKSPWSRRRRKHALLAKQWKSLFDVDGKLSDGGVKFLKKIRTGVEPSIRAEVWPFLLGFYDVKSSNKERETIRAQKRREYVELRRQCRQIIKRGGRSFKLKEMSGNNSNEDSGYVSQVLDSPSLDEVASARPSISMEVASLSGEVVSKDGHSAYLTSRDLAELEEDDGVITNDNASEDETNSSVSESSDDPEDTKPLLSSMDTEDNHPYEPVASTRDKLETQPASYKTENFATWRRIIRLDAIRANAEWIIYSPSQAEVSEEKARKRAESVELKDYDNLEPCRIYHAARLVAILEAYAVYDPEIGYCQGMSDLLSPIISVIEEDHVAFWCFVGFMRKARHNFRLDEVGIRRQLNIVSKIIKCKDSHLYNHLEKLQAEDCFFVYRMVVVLFRRELTFEQTLCLWEVMWADQAAIRAGIVKSAWRRMRLRAPPTDDLLLYAIAACVLQRRKLIIENYNSMDEIMRECNSMAGNLDVWKLLDDAHDLVVTLHDKI